MLEKSLVLDTCALLWLVKGDERLSQNARDAIEFASMVYVSAISAWEIGLKAERGDLILPMQAKAWFESSLERHSLIAAPVDHDIAFRAAALPRFHKDPADRFIIATAMSLSAAIVTADETFKEYGARVIG
jgi:PIN domain nuclease of toxin-antitoxin system